MENYQFVIMMAGTRWSISFCMNVLLSASYVVCMFSAALANTFVDVDGVVAADVI